MDKFLKKLIWFILIPISILWMLEVFCLPINYFAHRNWEALLLQSKIPFYGPWFPNVNIQSIEEGDLAHHTEFSVDKKVVWKTDKLGFRNEAVIIEPDILVIGDSFIAGSSLSQEQTFTNQLVKQFNGKIKIYNLAPSSFSYWVKLLDQGMIKKPQHLIFSIVERYIPEVFVPTKINYDSYRERVKQEIREKGVAPIVERWTRFYSLKWLESRIRNNKGSGIQSEIDKKMFFLQGKSVENRNEDDIHKVVEAIVSYKKYCDRIGVKFLFLPMPNKETVYFDLVPLSHQPNFLFRVESLLNQKGISTVNTLAIFNKRRSDNKFLYQLDDTHWNSYGVHIIASAVKEKLD